MHSSHPSSFPFTRDQFLARCERVKTGEDGEFRGGEVLGEGVNEIDRTQIVRMIRD
jgi:hypothetical protein